MANSLAVWLTFDQLSCNFNKIGGDAHHRQISAPYFLIGDAVLDTGRANSFFYGVGSVELNKWHGACAFKKKEELSGTRVMRRQEL